MSGNALLKLLDIQYPIIRRPRGGTPELVAAVSNAGGLALSAAKRPEGIPDYLSWAGQGVARATPAWDLVAWLLL